MRDLMTELAQRAGPHGGVLDDGDLRACRVDLRAGPGGTGTVAIVRPERGQGLVITVARDERGMPALWLLSGDGRMQLFRLRSAEVGNDGAPTVLFAQPETGDSLRLELPNAGGLLLERSGRGQRMRLCVGQPALRRKAG